MKAKKGQILICEDCPVQLEVIYPCDCGDGGFTCCGKEMKVAEEQTADATNEKHVPVVEKVEGGYTVKVGSVPHPMEEKHWIQWVELQVDGKVYKAYLQPGQAPEATFKVAEGGQVTAREHCNVHGLWRG